jgi:hypothetical protein
MRRSSTVSTCTKPAARMPRACAVRNCLQVGPGRRGCWIDPGVMKDLPHCGRRDLVAGLDELAVHAPVAPGGIIHRHADHERADRGCRGRPSRTPPARIIPSTCDQPPVPGEQRRRCHGEHLCPATPGDQPGQCRTPQPVARLVADPADLTAQHRVLMPQHQQLGVLGHLTPASHHQASEQAARKQADDRENHPAMISNPAARRGEIE